MAALFLAACGSDVADADETTNTISGSATDSDEDADATKEEETAKKEQTVRITELPASAPAGSTVTFETSSDSGLSLTFSTEGKCSVDAQAKSIQLEEPDRCTLIASSDGDDSWAPVEVKKTITGTAVDPQLEFSTELEDLVVGESVEVRLVSKSSGEVTLVAQPPATCSVQDDGTLTALAVGTCEVSANLAPAGIHGRDLVETSFEVEERPLAENSISWSGLADFSVGGSITVRATALGTAQPSISVRGGPCSISATGVVTASQPGVCILRAIVASDDDFESETDDETVTVTSPQQGILVEGNEVDGDTYLVQIRWSVPEPRFSAPDTQVAVEVVANETTCSVDNDFILVPQNQTECVVVLRAAASGEYDERVVTVTYREVPVPPAWTYTHDGGACLEPATTITLNAVGTEAYGPNVSVNAKLSWTGPAGGDPQPLGADSPFVVEDGDFFYPFKVRVSDTALTGSVLIVSGEDSGGIYAQSPTGSDPLRLTVC